MVNLDKLVDCRDVSDFRSETSEKLTMDKSNEENSHKQELIEELNSTKESSNSQSPLSLHSDLEENERLNNEDCSLSDINESNTQNVINNEKTENHIILQIDNNEKLIEQNEDSNLSEFNEATDNQLSLPQLNKHLNGIKKEDEDFYLLDLKWPNNSQLNLIFDQLRTMYIQQQLLDCTLVCENQCIKAHKLMLATVSSYFRSIFDSFNNLGCNNAAVVVDVPATDMRLIIKILYSINDCNPIRISLNRAISLRKSVYRLKIDFIDNQLDQFGIPQLKDDEIDLLSKIVESNSRKRKHSFYDNDDDDDAINNLESNNNLTGNLKGSQNNNQSSSESADEIDSECSTTMKHHKYKHRYLLSNEHLEKNNKIIRCGNDMLADQSIEEELLEHEKEQYDQQTNEDEDKIEIESNVSSNQLNHHHKSPTHEEDDNQKFLEKSQEDSQINDLNSSIDTNAHQQNEQNQKMNDFNLNKLANPEEILKLMGNSINNNSENADKVANIYKAMKKIWSNNNSNITPELLNNDNFNQIYKSQNNLANDFLNNTFSQLCMANANMNGNLNLNSDAARTLLLTNELLKNNPVNNHLNHSKNSGDNSLNTSTSSTNSSSHTVLNNQKSNSATAALVAAAQQHILNANFLNKSSNNLSKSNNTLINNPKSSNNLSSSNYSLQNNSSSASSYNKSSSSAPPVKRGRGRPPRHTQSASSSSETGSLTDDNQLNKSQQSKLTQSIKQQLNFTTSSLNNINSLNNLNSLNNTTNSIANSLNALSQHKKWRPNLENLLTLKMGKNKLNSNSPTNELTSLNSSSQNNLLKNDIKKSLSSNNTSNISNHYSQNGSLSSLTSKTNSTNNVNGSSSNSTDNKNNTQNICPYCPQVYYSTQAMNDHINNVHTKTAFKVNYDFLKIFPSNN